MRKVFLPLAILLIVMMVMTGCGKATPSATTAAATTTSVATPTATTEPADSKYGGTLKLLAPYSPASLPGWPADRTNPQAMWLNWICWEPLVRLAADGSPESWLATSWSWGPEKKSILFNLRQKVTFHDGTPFTAEAVKLQGDQIMSTGESNTLSWERWEIINDYSIKLYLKQYMTDFWGNIGATNMMFVSPTVLKQGVDYTKEHPVGTGPFKFKNYEKDVILQFVRNDAYWQEGRPYLDGIDMLTVREELTQRAKMETGEGDILVLQQGKILKDMKDSGFNVVTVWGGTNFLLFDTANEGAVTNDVRVREAIEYSINKQEMVDALGYGFLIANNQLSPPTNPGFNANMPSRDYDVAKAKKILADAGYTSLSIKLISDNNGQSIAIFIQQYLAEIGITVELEMVDNAKYWDYCMNGWTGVLNAGYSIGVNYPAVIKLYFPPASVLDKSCAIPQAILDKLDPAMLALDPAVAKQLSDDIVRMVYDDCLFVPLYSNAMGNIISTKIHDMGSMQFIDFSVWDAANTWKEK